MSLIEVNFVTVLLAGIVSMVLGAFWYSPAGFGKQWMKLSGISEADIKKAKAGIGSTYVAAFIASLVVAYVFAQFLGALAVVTFAAMVQLAFWIWLGFIATVLISGVLWKNEPMQLFCLNALYWLVNLIVIGLVLTTL